MAILPEGIHFTGTIGNVTYYEWNGRTYLRRKSSLTRKRVLKSKSFASTRKYAGLFGKAQKIGSEIYRALPADIKERWLYRAISGEAASLLYEGKTEQEAQNILRKKYITDTKAENDKTLIIKGKNMNHSTRETNKQLRELFRQRWKEQGLSDYYFKQAWQKRGYFSRERFHDELENAIVAARREIK